MTDEEKIVEADKITLEIVLSGIHHFSKNKDALARIIRSGSIYLTALNTADEIPAIKADIKRIIGSK